MELIIDPELERCLPPLPEVQFQKLRASIEKKYDPAKPIVLWKERPNTIVDGHHRYRACQETGQEPTTVVESFESLDDAVLYALQRQIEQRNLTTAQMIIITEQMMSIQEKQKLADAAKENLKTNQIQEMPSDEASEGRLSQEVARKIAEKAQTSAREVYRVHKIQKEGTPALVSLVESGEVCSDYADRFVKMVPDKSNQKAVIDSGGQKAVLDRARLHRDEEKAKRAAKKDEEERRKFQEFNQKVAQKTAEAHHKIEQIMGAANGGCLMPNVAELWCNNCEWGFDVFLPMPSSQSSCPYCKGNSITKRDPEWNPRLLPSKEL